MLGGRPTGLGKGLGAIIPQRVGTVSRLAADDSVGGVHGSASRFDAVVEASMSVHEIPLEFIDPNPHQPRSHFDHQDLEDLVLSIREHGVLGGAKVQQRLFPT